MTSAAHKNWYVVMTHARAEALAAEQLSRQGFEIYLPRIRKRRRHARKTETIPSPLFPRYLFVAFDHTCQRWQAIRSTLGVTHLIGAGNGPTRVPDQVLDELRGREDVHGFIQFDQDKPFVRGERVRIADGVFSLCNALFEFMSDNDRASLLLDLLGRQVRVLVDKQAVAPT